MLTKGALTITILIMVVLLTSCLGIVVETVFNEDGSGRMTVVFHISQALLELGEGESGFDVPLTKEDIMEDYEEVDGITVVDILQEDTDTDRIITAIIEFDDFNVLTQDDDFISENASLKTIGKKTFLRMQIGQAGGSGGPPTDGGTEQAMEMDDATKAMVQSFMEGYEFEYRIVAPKTITSYNYGELQSDGRTLVYALPMGDFFMIEEPYTLEVVW